MKKKNEIKIDVLNMGRMKYQTLPATKEDILRIFKSAKISYPEFVFVAMREKNIIIDSSRGEYIFKDAPIHLSVVESFVKDARTKQYNYQKKWESKGIKAPKNAPIPHVLNEESAIKFLKQKGYKIFKTELKEI